MIRIGNQTAYSARSVMEPFEFAMQQGFTAFEFFPDRGPMGVGGWAETDLGDSTRRWIQQSAVEYGIQLTVHAPLEFQPAQNPEDPRLHSVVTFAHDIGAALINLHLDVGAGPEMFVRSLKPTLLATAEAGLGLTLENTVWSGPADFNAFFSALHARADLPNTHVGMCFDLGHANLFGGTCNDYWKYLDALSPLVRITHLHLHENFGDRDSHLPLFTGPSRNNATGIAGMLKRVRQHGFSGCAILEQWPNPPALLVQARDGLLNLLGASRVAEGRPA